MFLGLRGPLHRDWVHLHIWFPEQLPDEWISVLLDSSQTYHIRSSGWGLAMLPKTIVWMSD